MTTVSQVENPITRPKFCPQTSKQQIANVERGRNIKLNLVTRFFLKQLPKNGTFYYHSTRRTATS